MPADRMPEPEEPVASATITADVELLPATVEFVCRVAHRLGLENGPAERLRKAVETVCKNVIESAFEPDDDGRYDVHVLRRPGRIVVAVEDMGMPFDYASLRDAGAPDGPLADGVRFVNLGRRGNRVELVEHLSHPDVRDHLPEEEHREAASAPVALENVPLQIRTMRPEESFELSRCVYRSYGYSYDWDSVYYPDRIRELQEADLMRSCVATSEDEIVGHLAVTVERPDAPVGEAGQAVVHPRFRGHHLFPKMKTFAARRAEERGMYGLYSEATAVHPYSQRGNLELGAKETGFLLGYIPASVSYKEIGEDRAGRRGSVALFYLRTNDEPERPIYPPAAYRDAVLRVIAHNGLHRAIDDGPDADALPDSRMSVDARPDHNLAFLRVEEPGRDLNDLVRRRLRELCLRHVDGVFADLPLSHPATARAAGGLSDLGFFFGGIIPEAHPTGGDVLRLQYLNEVDFEPSDVKTASGFGHELLALILHQREAIT